MQLTYVLYKPYEQIMLSPISLYFISVLNWMFCSTKKMQLTLTGSPTLSLSRFFAGLTYKMGILSVLIFLSASEKMIHLGEE